MPVTSVNALLHPTQKGVREDLADYIAVVDAKSTPFTSMIPKGKELGNMKFDWQVDNYAPIKLGGVRDGEDMDPALLSNASANRERFENYAQVFQRDFRVGFIADQMNVAGVSDEVARSVSKRMLEMKRDIEATLLLSNWPGHKEDVAGPYQTASLGTWVDTTNVDGDGAPTAPFATPAASKYTGTSAALTETNVQAVLESIYQQTGQIRSYDLIMGTTLKRAFTNLISGKVESGANTIVATSVRTFNMDIASDKYKHAVQVFEGDFGTLMLHPDVFIGRSDIQPALNDFDPAPWYGYVIPMEMCELRYTQLPKVQDLPDMGGGPAKLIRAIAGLVVKNSLGFGFFKCSDTFPTEPVLDPASRTTPSATHSGAATHSGTATHAGSFKSKA